MRLVSLSLFAASLLSTLLLNACSDRPRNDNATLKGDDANEVIPTDKPILVMMGGFNSCVTSDAGFGPDGQGLDEPSRKLEAALDEQVAANVKRAYGNDEETASYTPPRWVMSCYDKSGTMYIRSAHGPAAAVQTDGDHLDPLFAAIIGEERPFWPSPVYFISHSHGGWTAMQAVLKFEEYANREYSGASAPKIGGLVTIDPISYKNCGPSTYITAAAITVGAGVIPAAVLNPLAECQVAPSDISNAERAQIIQKVGPSRWKHYYQTNFIPLHSGPFDGDAQPSLSLDMSSFLSVSAGGAVPSFNGHTAIHTLTSIWYSTEVMIKQDLAPRPR